MLEAASPPRPGSREAILAAAKDLFAARGLSDVTMADIAEAADVSRATVFNQFGSKASVLDAIVAEVLRAYLAKLDACLADNGHHTAEIILDMFSNMGAGVEANAAFYRAVFSDVTKMSVGSGEGSEASKIRGPAFERLVQIMLRGQARGELNRAVPAEDLAITMDALVFGAVLHWLHKDEIDGLAAAMRRMASVYLAGAMHGAESPWPKALEVAS